YRGVNVAAPLNEKSKTIVMISAKVKIRNLNTRNSSIGSFKRICHQINRAIITAPIPIVPMTSGLVHPSLEAILNPYKNDPNPIDDKIIDKISILGLLSSVKFFKK